MSGQCSHGVEWGGFWWSPCAGCTKEADAIRRRLARSGGWDGHPESPQERLRLAGPDMLLALIECTEAMEQLTVPEPFAGRFGHWIMQNREIISRAQPLPPLLGDE